MLNRNRPPKKPFKCDKIKEKHTKRKAERKMVREKMYNKIQEYKQTGYTMRKTARELDIDRKTVRKYWYMD